MGGVNGIWILQSHALEGRPAVWIHFHFELPPSLSLNLLYLPPLYFLLSACFLWPFLILLVLYEVQPYVLELRSARGQARRRAVSAAALTAQSGSKCWPNEWCVCVRVCVCVCVWIRAACGEDRRPVLRYLLHNYGLEKRYVFSAACCVLQMLRSALMELREL